MTAPARFIDRDQRGGRSASALVRSPAPALVRRGAEGGQGDLGSAGLAQSGRADRSVADDFEDANIKRYAHLEYWRALRKSNPCFRRERAASWTARRRARTTRERRCGKRATYKEVWLRAQSKRLRSNVLMEPDLFGEPVSTFPDHARAASNRSRGGFEGPRGWPVTSARYWASTARAPSAAAPRLSATIRSNACRVSARTPSCRRAAVG